MNLAHEIEKWRGVQAEALMGGHPPDNAAASFPAILDAAERSLTEQSRIDEAVAKERERCAVIADSFARRNREWAATARAGGADQLTALFAHSADAAAEVRYRILSPVAPAEQTP